MWHPWTASPPVVADEPLQIAQAKVHLRVDRDDEDELIQNLIAASRDHAERYCNACFAEQTVTMRCDNFSDMSRLPLGPLKSVTSITYFDEAGEVQTLAPETYEEHKDGLEPWVGLKADQTWPRTKPETRITLVAVFGGDAPATVVQAILLLIGAWYENREQTVIGTIASPLPGTVNVDALLSNHRRGV